MGIMEEEAMGIMEEEGRSDLEDQPPLPAGMGKRRAAM
jgi:hypothetical protein